MRLPILVTLVSLIVMPEPAFAWSLFSPTVISQAVADDNPKNTDSPVPAISRFLLNERPQKPGFYTDAIIELKRLEERPLCYRTAAQLLMSNCRGLEDIRKDKYEAANANFQRHYVESFAAGLTMCDMERARFEIPEGCSPFRSSALNAAIEGSGKVEVSANQVSECLQGLGRDHSHWSTWLSYRDTALLLCRGASLEVDKDNMLNLQKELVRQMGEFSDGLYADLRDLRQRMAHNVEALDITFEKIRRQTEGWRHEINDLFGSVSGGIKAWLTLLKTVMSNTDRLQEANLAVKSIIIGTNDAFRLMKTLLTTTMQANAEMAAEQERALVTTTKTLKTSMGGVHDLVGQAEIGLTGVQGQIGLLVAMVASMADRQDMMEQASQTTLNALINATELLQSHTQNLQRASASASTIHDHLEKASAEAMIFRSRNSGVLNWAIRAFCPFITLYGGNFGTTASISSNLGLVSLGLGVAELINLVRNVEWSSKQLPGFIELFARSTQFEPSAFTQRVVAWKSITGQKDDPR